MNSEEDSFRDIYTFPSSALKTQKNRSSNRRKGHDQGPGHKLESFDKFVRKTKNVVLFAQKLKQQIGKNHIFNIHTLSDKELEYLENQSSDTTLSTYFTCDSKLVFAVEVFFVLVLMLYSWKCSFEVVFRDNPLPLLGDFLTLGGFVLQVTVFCFTEYKNKMQQTTTNCRLIWHIYLEDKCRRDLLTLALIIVQVFQVDQYLSSAWVPQALRVMVVLLLVQRLKESAGGIEETIALTTNAETMMAMLKLLFKILVLIHILSLVLNLMAEVEKYCDQPITWLSANNFDVGSQFERYVAGWYWGATILSSVGFGDITPSNYIERFIISFVQILCCMSFGYFVNVIGSLIRLRTEQDEKYEKESRFLNRYLNALTLTQDLKLKVRSHFQNKHKVEKTLDSAEQQTVLENLTPVLKCSLLEENNITVLKKSSKFEHMREQTLTRLARVLKRVMFAPEHVIYSRESSEMKLWLLESGEVNEYTHHFGDSHFEKKIASYDPTDSAIGWPNFLTQRKYTTVARASEFTVAYELDEAKLRSVLQDEPKDWFKILQTKQLMMENRKKYVQKCLSCDRYTHNAIDCPRIHFIRRDLLSIIRQDKTMEKYREEEHQRKKRKFRRGNARDNWKLTFAGNALSVAYALQGRVEERTSLNMSIDYFIRNLTRIQSTTVISSKMISMAHRLESRDSNIDYKDINQAVAKSVSSIGMSTEEVQEVIYDGMLSDRENKAYFPHSNIDQVLKGCNSHKIKLNGQATLKLFQFIKKE